MAMKSTTYRGTRKPFGAGGWYNESRRHSLSAKGIRTGNLTKKDKLYLGYLATKTRFLVDGNISRTQFVKDIERYKKVNDIKDADLDGVQDKDDCNPFNIHEQDDLELKDLGQFYGTNAYHRISPFAGKTVGTDGVAYIMKNGYHWFVSDMVIVINMKPNLKKQEFLAVKLKINPDKSAVATIEDGNNKVLYKQEYKYTDAKKNLTLYHTNDVLMLSGEY